MFTEEFPELRSDLAKLIETRTVAVNAMCEESDACKAMIDTLWYIRDIGGYLATSLVLIAGFFSSPPYGRRYFHQR